MGKKAMGDQTGPWLFLLIKAIGAQLYGFFVLLMDEIPASFLTMWGTDERGVKKGENQDGYFKSR
jgi:hypothetical protein